MPSGTISTILTFIALVGTLAVGQSSPQQFLDRAEAMKWFLESYKPQVESILKEVIRHASPEHKERLGGSTLSFVPEEEPFTFYAEPLETKTIHLSLGGLNALDCSATAFSLALHVLEDDSWWFRYLLLNRQLRKTPNANWADALQTARVARSDLSEEENRRLVLSWNDVFTDMMAFVISHEAGHVALLHDGEQHPGESERDYLRRLRAHERDADAFAFDIVNKMGVNPFAVVTTLLTHLIVSEDKTDEADHPEDGLRIQHAIDYYARRNAPESFLNAARGVVSMFHVPGQSPHDALDMLARGISPEELRRQSR